MKLALLLPFLLAGCATVPDSAGRAPILHYLRTNIDGSEPEHVVQFRPTRTAISVYKWVSKCTTAAYVTAEMDGAVREGRLFVAGKVAPDGGQARFGTLTLDPAEPALVVDISPPGGDRIQLRHRLQGRPFIIFDFDLADLNAILQEHPGAATYTLTMPVVWPGEPTLFRDYGTLRAINAGTEDRDGRRVRRYTLTVAGPKPGSGTLWVDATADFIVEAELNLPNHAEYKDFRLKLERVETGGTAAWDALTRGHYANCPTGN